MTLPSGTVLGRYEIRRLLGVGGMGEVYLAHDPALDRPVALKVVTAHLRESGELQEQLAREARAASALNHPNIITIHDIGRFEGGHYIACELVEGLTLRRRLEGGALPPAEAVDVAVQTAAALAAAHAHGIVHGDVKPENVMVRADGLVKLLDFGIARLREHPDGAPSDTGFGTLRYMAPESVRRLQCDPQGDVWSLGVVLYEMLCGQPPYAHPEGPALLYAILTQAPPPLSLAIPLGRTLDAIMARVMARDPAARYPSAVELYAHLLRLRMEIERHAEDRTDRLASLPAPAEARCHNLPTPLGPLVGRALETQTAIDLLRRPDVRLVTLTGPGGSGKTRLAVHLAHALATELGEGAWFVPLASLTDPRLVLPALAQVLGVKETGTSPLHELLVAELADRELLIVADNFEQVAGAAVDVAELLAACARVKVLATSRTTLAIAGEHELPVPPLELPEADLPISADRLIDIPSVALFVQRAKAAKPDFALTDANAPAVALLCRRLDGLPLAIELAAARIKALPPEAMLPRLERRLSLLRSASRDRPPRHQTMRAAISWGHQLLEDGEKTLFRRLSVSAGSFTLAAAEEIAPAAGALDLDVLDGIGALIDKSWLQPASGAEPRYTMLETLREYGLEQLDAAGELAATRAAHARHHRAVAAGAEHGLRTARQSEWLDELERDHDNMRAALAFHIQAGDAEAAITMASSLWWFWYLHGHYTEGGRMLDQALQLFATTPARAKALLGAGTLAFLRCDYPRAAQLLQECVAAARALGDDRSLASALQTLGSVARERGDYGQAMAHHRESLALWRALGDEREIGRSENYLAFAAWLQGDLARASEACRDTLGRLRDLADGEGTAWALLNLAALALHGGDAPRAAELGDECLALCRRIGFKEGIGWAQDLVGNAAIERGDVDSARTALTDSLRVHNRLGDRWRQASVIEALARVAARAGDEATAARLLGVASGLREEVGTPIPPVERGNHQSTVESIRAALGEARYAAAFAEGRASPRRIIEPLLRH